MANDRTYDHAATLLLRLFFGALLIAPHDVPAQARLGQTIISGYEQRGCVKKGEQVTILGMGFGNMPGFNHVVLWGYGQNINLTVVSWFDSRITVTLSSDARVGEGRVYQIGLQDQTGNWLSNIGPAIKICPAPIAVTERAAVPVAPVAVAVDPKAQAQALADAVVKASGGDNWPKVRAIDFTFNVSAGTNLLMSAKHHWDVWNGTDTVTWAGKTANVNMWNPGNDASAKAAYARWVNDSYWLLAPLKLKDDGVTLTYTGSKDGFEVLHLSFAKVGMTPGDQYNLYIDPGTSLVRRWDYMPAPDKKTTGTWDGYKDFGGLKLSTEHKFGDKRVWFSDIKVETQ